VTVAFTSDLFPPDEDGDGIQVMRADNGAVETLPAGTYELIAPATIATFGPIPFATGPVKE